MKLTLKLTLAFVLAVFTTLGVVAWVRAQREVAHFESDMRRDHALLGRALADAVSLVWRTDGEARALTLLQESNARQSQVRIRWVWPDYEGDRGASHAAALEPLRPGEEVHLEEREGDRAGRLLTYIPVTTPDGRRGTIELAESLAEERTYVLASLGNTVAASVALTVFCALLEVVLGLWLIGRPLRALTGKARRIGAGDLSGRLVLPRRDEISELAEEMNAMCDLLSAANGKIAAATAARIAALEQLRHADRLTTVGKLASGLAHELGTPLNVVLGRARMVAAGEVEGEEARQSARIIAEQTDRMARIIRQLLDFARSRGPNKLEVELGTLVRQTMTLLAPMAEKRSLEVALLLEERLLADVDPGQIQQALTNLIVNAIQAMPPGKRLTVSLAAQRARAPADLGGEVGSFLCLAVRDEGVGIAPENLERIFEPFFTTKEVGEGTGLGLSVTYGLVREHRGFITVESAPDKGSLFTLFLPAKG